MTQRMMKLAVLVAAGYGAALAGPVITLSPASGFVSGLAGTNVGWGFTVQSDAVDWVSFVTSFPALETNAGLGTYTDFIGGAGGPVNAVLAPGGPAWVQGFSFNNRTGLGSFAISPGAPLGSVDQGSLHIEYELFSGDPNVCGRCDLGPGSVDLPFSVKVTSVPEPGTLALGTAGLLLALWRLRGAGPGGKNRHRA